MERGSRHLSKIISQHSRPQFHLSLLGSLASYGRGRRLAAEMGTSKITGGGGNGRTINLYCGASGSYAPGPDDDEEEEEEASYIVGYVRQMKFILTL